MHLWSLWLIVAVVFLIIELFSQSVWGLCAALGALGAMGCALLDWSPQIQGAALIGVCILAYAVLLPILQKIYTRNAKPIATGMDALIDRKVIVTEAYSPGHPGRVKIDGDNWQIEAEDRTQEIPTGTEVTVVGYESIILIVKI